MQSSEEESGCRIVVAGGGFAGGTLALALARLAPKTCRVTLVDAAPSDAERDPDGRGLALSPAARNLLNAIGLWSRLTPDAQSMDAIEVTDSPLNAALRPHLLGFADELRDEGTKAWLVEAGALLAAIADEVKREPAIDLIAPDAVESFDCDPFSTNIRLAGGRTLRASLLVAADGKKSRLRERAGIKCIGWSYAQTGIVATVAHERPHNGRAVQHFLPAGPFAILPLKGNRSSIVWTEEAETAKRLIDDDPQVFVDELSRRFGHRLGTITLEDPPRAFPLSFQMARRFVGDRLALVGDAAHVVHPLAGQGLNIGLRDVAALVETVTDSVRLGLDIGSPTALARYERWRRFDSAFSAVAMDGMNRLFSNDSAPLRTIRDLGMALVDRAPGLKRFLVREAAGATGDVPRLLKGEAL
ncbi:MAG: FAD-dependent monooxygenase [Methyloceanibacter sp.]|nr:FAD-dependent monooxygenase [Methyloceanibacter sp.]